MKTKRCIHYLIAVIVMAGTLSGCLGCGGGKTIQLQLDSTHEQPVWLGTYLLSKEAALDGRPNSELTNKETARGLGPADGVIDYDVRPLYPGEPFTFLREDYDPAVSTILVVANFPRADPCARTKIPVKGSVKLTISVVDKCLKIAKKD